MDLLKATDCLWTFWMLQVTCRPPKDDKIVESMEEKGYDLGRVLWMLRGVNEDKGC